MAPKLNAIGSLTKAKQAEVLKDLNKTLKKHAVSGSVAEFHVAAGASKMICKKVNGKLVCKPE